MDVFALRDRKWLLKLFRVLLATFGCTAALYASADRLAPTVGDVSQAQLLAQYPVFQEKYTAYETPKVVLGLPSDLTVTIFFGTWCHDSEREVPRVLKLLAASGVEEKNISLIGLDIRKQEPEGRAKVLGIKYTPTFIFFSGGKEIGRIIERPTISLRDDIAAIASVSR